MSVIVYIVRHKDCLLPPLSPCYQPIFVGNGNKPENDVRDNLGDNISFKNSDYCELTALYWMWKNGESDVYGLVHYRRMLGGGLLGNHILTEADIKHIMSSYDLILPSLVYSRKVVQDNDHRAVYLSCLQSIRKICPEYQTSFKRFFRKNVGAFYNMFIGKKNLMDSYCCWLFPLLSDLEKTYGLPHSRLYGYVSERLFNVWVLYNHPRVFRANVLLINGSDSVCSWRHSTKYLFEKIFLKL